MQGTRERGPIGPPQILTAFSYNEDLTVLTFDLPASATFSDATTLTSGQGLDPTLFGFRPRNCAKSVVFRVVGTSYNLRVWCKISTTARGESGVRPGARLLCRGLAVNVIVTEHYDQQVARKGSSVPVRRPYRTSCRHSHVAGEAQFSCTFRYSDTLRERVSRPAACRSTGAHRTHERLLPPRSRRCSAHRQEPRIAPERWRAWLRVRHSGRR
jgi:hypothetical protein